MPRHPSEIHTSPMLPVAVAGVCMWLIGCSSQPRQGNAQSQPQAQPAQAQAAAQAQEKRYDLKGKVMGVDKARKQVSVAGEEIPGFMGAMTMSYPVKNEEFLERLAAGDQITAKVVASGTEYWLENIAVVDKPK